MARILLPVVVIFDLAFPVAASAQGTVQQPVVGVHGVRTGISVPDRGTAYLGGVSRAGSSRSMYGPLRSGTSSGWFREHSGTSVHVQIIDLGEMDRAVLESVDRPRFQPGPLHGQAAAAYQSLHVRKNARQTYSGQRRR